MTNPYTTPITELFRLFEQGKLNQLLGADYGISLDTVLARYGYVFADLVPTLTEDFDDIAATIGDNTEAQGAKTWFAPGCEPVIGISTHQAFSFTPAMYTQDSASILAMRNRKNAGVARRTTSLTTGTFGADLDHEPKLNFCQQFGFFECKLQANGGNGTNITCWDGPWRRSINFLGGPTYGNVFKTNIEDDIVEVYPSDVVGQSDSGTHISLHKHEPQKLIQPGQWGRDVFDGDYSQIKSNPSFGNDPNFQFHNDYHQFGLFECPDFHWYFLDRKLVCKSVKIPEMHEKYFLLLQSGVLRENTGGWTPEIDSKMLVDYYKAWQVADWQTTPGGNQLSAVCLTGGGTANAKTLTSITAMAAYANGRSFVAKFSTANTAATTLNVNSIGAKNVYKRPVQNIFPNSGTPIALTGGELAVGHWKYFSYDTTLNAGAGGWLLHNPHFSMERMPLWAPIPYDTTPIVVSRTAIEAGMVEKHSIDRTLFPVDHPARVPVGIDPLILTPKMLVNKTFIKVTGLTAGTVVGQIQTIDPQPSDAVRYIQIGSTTHYSTNPTTGEIIVAPGHTTAAGIEEFLVYAWPTTPRAIIRGSNVTRVIMDIRADDDWSFEYFNVVGGLKTWTKARDATTVAVDGSNNVITLSDKATGGPVWQQDPLEVPLVATPVYSATGFNAAKPALIGATGRKLTPFVGDIITLPISQITSVVTRINPGGLRNMSINLHGISRQANPFDYLDPCFVMFTWQPGSWTFWANGAEVGPDVGASQLGITTTGFYFAALDCVSPGGSNLGNVYGSGRLFNGSTGNAYLDGAMAEEAGALTTLTQELIDKIFGYAADPTQLNLRSALPALHPYKSVTPKMWR